MTDPGRLPPAVARAAPDAGGARAATAVDVRADDAAVPSTVGVTGAAPQGLSRPLPAEAARALLLGPVDEVAPRLLGAHLTAGEVTVRLTEVEAYAGEADPGSHAFRGPTPRTEVMFGPPGVAYVYFSYGMHWCLNVVTAPAGTASAVLVRAGEVLDGLEVARVRRAGASDRDLCRGPARLTRALGVDGALAGTDLLDPGARLRLELREPQGPWSSGPRVGVAGAGAPTPWRFWLDAEPSVSPYRPAAPRRKAVRTASTAAGGSTT